MLSKTKLLICASLTLLLSSCGGGSGSPSNNGANGQPGAVLTGVFVDSAVAGAAYSTESQSGVTNADGEFNYVVGESVTFSIGDIQFPTVTAKPTITPLDLAQGSDDKEATKTNIARLLQTLDVDANPDNGIVISSEVDPHTTELDFNVSTNEFESNTDVINIAANSGSTNTGLVSTERALEHLNATLESQDTNEQNNVVTGNSGDDSVLTGTLPCNAIT